MAAHDLIVIGASAGGVGALQKIAEQLDADLPVPVLVALHLPDGVRSVLPAILSRAGSLPATHAVDGETMVPRHIYIAPPGFHLTVEDGRMRVARGAREHGVRPAIDPLFRSAALAYGARAIGVILSGLLDDGTAGLLEIKRAGGIAVVQDPADTPWPSMPQHALAQVAVDHCLPADQIGALLGRLVVERARASSLPRSEERLIEDELEVLTMHADDRDKPGDPSPYACPECGGVLWEMKDGEMLRFRCRVGHAYSTETLTGEQALAVEHSLWTALRALEEQAAVKRRLADRSTRLGHVANANRYARRSRELEEHAQRVRDLLMSGVGAAEPSMVEGDDT